MQQCVTLSELAQEWGLDRSSVRKYLIKHGFRFSAVRPAGSRGQAALALSTEDAEAARTLRQDQGWGGQRVERVEMTERGVFYVIALIPEFSPNRVKLGFATDIRTRLAAHRTAAPTAKLLHTWLCMRAWEVAALASIAREGCTCIGGEVFDVVEPMAVIARGDAFFALLPPIS